MSMIAKCDGCGKEQPASTNGRDWFKPWSWFERTPEGEDAPIMACSRECIQRVESERAKGGKESMTVVLPI